MGWQFLNRVRATPSPVPTREAAQRTRKTFVLVILALGLAAAAVPLLRQSAPPEPPANGQPAEDPPPAPVPAVGPRLRLGTLRLRQAGAIGGLAVSPTAPLLASCGRDGQVRLWDPDTGAEVRRLAGPD